MSDEIDAKVLLSIHANRWDESRGCFNCGCHQRGKGWYLCAYHDGFSDGLDDAEDEIKLLQAKLYRAERFISDFAEGFENELAVVATYWRRDGHPEVDLGPDPFELQPKIRAFAAEVAAKGIHMGMAADGTEVRCVLCREPWPCQHSTNLNWTPDA